MQACNPFGTPTCNSNSNNNGNNGQWNRPHPRDRAGYPRWPGLRKESVNNIFHKFNWQQAEPGEGEEQADRQKEATGRQSESKGQGRRGEKATIERTRAITINDRYLPQQESSSQEGDGAERGVRERGYSPVWANDAEKVS